MKLDFEGWFGEWEERAAIREYDGGFERRIAEGLAYKDIVARFGFPPPRSGSSDPLTLEDLRAIAASRKGNSKARELLARADDSDQGGWR